MISTDIVTVLTVQVTAIRSAMIAEWLTHSLATAATRDRIPVSACGRVVVAHPRSVVFPGSPVSSNTYDHRTLTSAPSRTRLCVL